jgi:hypothetical protein
MDVIRLNFIDVVKYAWPIRGGRIIHKVLIALQGLERNTRK